MENACHTLCGLALARAGGDRLGPLATPTLVVAANLPDIDIVGWAWGGKPWYLCHHRGLTHALVGLAALSLLLAAAMHALGRARGHPVRFRGLWLAAGIGLLSHLALDSLNTYGVRPWLPFDGTWYYGDVAFIVDPWLWLLFGAGACLGAPRGPGPAAEDAEHSRATPGLDALAPRGAGAAATAPLWPVVLWWGASAFAVLLLLSLERSPGFIAALWGPAMLGVLVARARGVGATRRRLAAWGCLGLAAVYLLVLGALGREADARARAAVRAEGHTVAASTCHPAPAVPWRFRAVVESTEHLHTVEVDLRSGAVADGILPLNRDDPALPRVRHTPEYAAWRVFARHPFVARTEQGRLVLGDGRYAPHAGEDWCNFVLPVPPP